MLKDALYNAQVVADYLIGWCADRNIAITNVRLNKILYFCQVEFARLRGCRLISEDFFAYRLGPVIPSVREKYVVYAASPLPRPNNPIQLSYEDRIVLDAILSRYVFVNIWDLVEAACQTEPYKYNLQIFGERAIIPYECIEKFATQKQNKA